MAIETISNVGTSVNYHNQENSPAKVSPVEGGETSRRISTNIDATANTTSETVHVNQIDNGQTEHTKLLQDQKEEKEQNIKEKAKEVNKKINRNTIAEFGYNEPTNRFTIKIKDKDTQEIIKEIPSEEALKLLEKAWEIAGILVDEKR